MEPHNLVNYRQYKSAPHDYKMYIELSYSSKDEYVRSATPTKKASVWGVKEKPAISPNRSTSCTCTHQTRFMTRV